MVKTMEVNIKQVKQIQVEVALPKKKKLQVELRSRAFWVWPQGFNVILQKTATHLQWKTTDPLSTWQNLVPLIDLKGDQWDPWNDGSDWNDWFPVEFIKSATHIQWRVQGSSTWIDLVPLVDLKGIDGVDGDDGRAVELQKGATHLQWRYAGDTSWTNIVSLDEIKWLKGDTWLGFRIAKTYSTVSNLLADTSPTWIAVGEFALISSVLWTEDPDHWRLYLWSGTAYDYITDIAWLDGLKGDKGDQWNPWTDAKQVEFQKTATHIQWRRVGETRTNLVALVDIKWNVGDTWPWVPNGGDQYAILMKNSAWNFDTVRIQLSTINGQSLTNGGDLQLATKSDAFISAIIFG